MNSSFENKMMDSQICKHCGHENAPLKRCCEICKNFLEGYCYNNVSGEFGYRNADGSFTPVPKPKTTSDRANDLAKAIETFKNEVDQAYKVSEKAKTASKAFSRVYKYAYIGGVASFYKRLGDQCARLHHYQNCLNDVEGKERAEQLIDQFYNDAKQQNGDNIEYMISRIKIHLHGNANANRKEAI